MYCRTNRGVKMCFCDDIDSYVNDISERECGIAEIEERLRKRCKHMLVPVDKRNNEFQTYIEDIFRDFSEDVISNFVESKHPQVKKQCYSKVKNEKYILDWMCEISGKKISKFFY